MSRRSQKVATISFWQTPGDLDCDCDDFLRYKAKVSHQEPELSNVWRLADKNQSSEKLETSKAELRVRKRRHMDFAVVARVDRELHEFTSGNQLLQLRQRNFVKSTKQLFLENLSQVLNLMINGQLDGRRWISQLWLWIIIILWWVLGASEEPIQRKWFRRWPPDKKKKNL